MFWCLLSESFQGLNWSTFTKIHKKNKEHLIFLVFIFKNCLHCFHKGDLRNTSWPIPACFVSAPCFSVGLPLNMLFTRLQLTWSFVTSTLRQSGINALSITKKSAKLLPYSCKLILFMWPNTLKPFWFTEA